MRDVKRPSTVLVLVFDIVYYFQDGKGSESVDPSEYHTFDVSYYAPCMYIFRIFFLCSLYLKKKENQTFVQCAFKSNLSTWSKPVNTFHKFIMVFGIFLTHSNMLFVIIWLLLNNLICITGLKSSTSPLTYNIQQAVWKNIKLGSGD